MKKGIIIVLTGIITILIGLNKVNASENIYSNYWSDLKGLDGNLAPAVISGYYGSTLNERDNYFYYTTPKTWKINDFEYLEIPFYTNYYNIVQDFNSSTNASGSININNGLEVFILTTINGNLSSQICNIKENTGSYYIAKCPYINGITNIKGFRVDLRTESLGSYLLPSIKLGFSRDLLFYEYNGSMSEISDNQQQTNNILTGEQDYNKEASEQLNGKEEINNYTEKEEELFGNLDFEGIGNNEITINPNASTFIWEIIERLRGMNGKIVLLMTSILGLGIIKMILNR